MAREIIDKIPETSEYLDEDLASRILRTAQKNGANYTDLRMGYFYEGFIDWWNGRVRETKIENWSGFGIRALANHAWGFASGIGFSTSAVAKTVELSVKMAKVGGIRTKGKVKLADSSAQRGTQILKGKQPVHNVPIEEIKEILDECKGLTTRFRNIFGTEILIWWRNERTLISNSEGTSVITERPLVVMMPRITAKMGEKVSSYKEFVGGCGGFELTSRLQDSCVRVSDIASKALGAREFKGAAKEYVIFEPSCSALLAHENLGHSSEADMETTFFRSLGERVASEVTNVIDAPDISTSAGYTFFDAEGVRATRRHIVSNGTLTGRIHNRETAANFGEIPNGGSRCAAFWYPPLVRASDTRFDVGDWRLDEILADTPNGFLVIGSKGISSDSHFSSWSLQAELAYEVKNGEVLQTYRNVAVKCNTIDFLKSLDAFSDKSESFVAFECVKGEPPQILPSGMGGPYLRGLATVVRPNG